MSLMLNPSVSSAVEMTVPALLLQVLCQFVELQTYPLPVSVVHTRERKHNASHLEVAWKNNNRNNEQNLEFDDSNKSDFFHTVKGDRKNGSEAAESFKRKKVFEMILLDLAESDRSTDNEDDDKDLSYEPSTDSDSSACDERYEHLLTKASQNVATHPAFTPSSSTTTQPAVSQSGFTTIQPAISLSGSTTTQPVVSLSDSTTTQPAVSLLGSTTTQPAVSLSGSTTTQPVVSLSDSTTTQPAIRLSDSTTIQPALRQTCQPQIVPESNPSPIKRFHLPKSDRCDQCEMFRVSEQEGLLTPELLQEKEKQTNEKNAMRNERNLDRENKTKLVVRFDLQNVINCPRANGNDKERVTKFYLQNRCLKSGGTNALKTLETDQ
ncbi:NADP-ubiquinone oxidoreductase 23 kda subunit [Plakobranchus ocellatus]|uniref:NADP-ubiquinone oxidoreductase 23 kDa subunit n=1 Tax=Plakobranchus ocellatus TaxID=259542 RepID=A0AAV4BM83_9GAST|nr:NADP-ubiquinone oxidoreductase 23 kda subunit [Plakobranchus ocellatus]